MFMWGVKRVSSAGRLLIALVVAFGMNSNVSISAQDSTTQLRFFESSSEFHKGRFWGSTATLSAAYTATVIGLNEIWYKQYPRGGFRFNNDWGEWENVDKVGHMFTTYMYSRWIADLYHWTGVPREQADWIGVGTGMLFQTTLELLDGFSKQWGFSWSDMAFNTIGAGTYIGQQKLWGEQRIVFKFSSSPINHPSTTILSTDGESVTTVDQRAADLFGNGFFEMLLKDYNAQTIWTSVNIHSFLREESRFPRWLNVAFGFGAYNMYGASDNTWEDDGALFVLDDNDFPRYQQYYLSLDVDFTRIRTRSPLLKTLFGLLNVIKVPAPAIEFNRVDGVRFHAIRF